MDSVKYIGLDVHKETISIAVLSGTGRVVMESIIETKATTILQFIQGLRGNLNVTFEEGTWAAWLYDQTGPSATWWISPAGIPRREGRTNAEGALAQLLNH